MSEGLVRSARMSARPNGCSHRPACCARPELGHRMVDVPAANQADQHVGRGVVALGDHHRQELGDREAAPDPSVGEIAPAPIAIGRHQRDQAVEVEFPERDLAKNLDHHGYFYRRGCRHVGVGVDRAHRARREVLDLDGDVPGRVRGRPSQFHLKVGERTGDYRRARNSRSKAQTYGKQERQNTFRRHYRCPRRRVRKVRVIYAQ